MAAPCADRSSRHVILWARVWTLSGVPGHGAFLVGVGWVGQNAGMRLPVMPPVKPMLAKPVKEIPRGELSYEPKWDGFRSIIFRDGDEVEIGSRNEKPMTRYFPELVEAIKANFFQAEIAEAAFRYQTEVEQKQRIVVGVNKYQLAEPSPELHRVDPILEQQQIQRVRALRARRDSPAVEAALARLKEDAAHDDRNLMGPIVDASRAYVTMGEMCDTLREVWGVWRETPVF